MYTVKPTVRFTKDLKRIEKRGYNISLITGVIKKLAKDEKLDAKYHDHALKGNSVGMYPF
jgi:mRNA interferase YafQ